MVELELLPAICLNSNKSTSSNDVVKRCRQSHSIFVPSKAWINYKHCCYNQNSFNELVKICYSRKIVFYFEVIHTWLRSTMTQKRFNTLSLIHENQANVDKMSLIDVANQLVNLHSAHLNIFGRLTDQDI